MPNFRRYYIPNAYVFITCVTKDRKPYLQSEDNIHLFWETLRNVQDIHPLNLLAYVIIPDHFHWLMRLGDLEGYFSKVLHSFKWNFTRNYKHLHGVSAKLNIWQPRFWDHVIRNEHDLAMHFDYIHWNPVKHDLVGSPESWPHSSFLFWYERGDIPQGWGSSGEPETIAGMDFE